MSLWRSLLMAKKQQPTPVPYYCEIEYLEGTGTQYIDTGVQASTSLYVQASAQPNTIHTGCVIGIHTGATTTWRIEYRIDGTVYQTTYNYTAGEKNIFKQSIGSAVLDIDGVEYASGRLAENASTSLYLFALNLFGTASEKLKGRIYDLKIYNGDTILRDYIPVLDFDMVPCMYDKVSGQLFYNQGTGQFTYGREIHKVDYLEGTGTQYIDTGLRLTNNNKCEVVYKTDSPAFGCVFGSRTSASVNNIGSLWDTTGHPVVDFNNSLYSTYRAIYNSNTLVGKKIKGINDKNGRYIYADDVLKTSNTNVCTDTILTPANCFLFKMSGNPPSDVNFSGNIYYFKLWDNDTLVRDYIPAIDENGVAFMFDRVSHTIFDNAGTGAFDYGTAVSMTSLTGYAATPDE